MNSEVIKEYCYKLGLYNIKEHDNKIICTCPIHQQPEDKPPKGTVYFDTGIFNCFKCGSMTLESVIEEYFHGMLEEYREEVYQYMPVTLGLINDKLNRVKNTGSRERIVKIDHSILNGLQNAFDVPIAKDYLRSRRFLDSQIKRFYYSDNYMKFGIDHGIFTPSSDKFNVPIKDSRIVIPDIQEDHLVFLQGRAMYETPIRYLTFTVNNGFDKIWGLDTINKNKLVYVFEGTFDAIFINNSISMLGGSFDPDMIHSRFPSSVFCPDGDIWDNDSLQKVSMKFSELGGSVFIMPYFDYLKAKDINSLIQKNVIAIDDVNNYIKKNTFRGGEAFYKIQMLNYEKNTYRKI